jgi:hypothetical protein
MTGYVIPDRTILKTYYEGDKLVRHVTLEQVGNGINVTDVRCTCSWPQLGCSLHSKSPEPPA